jgi:hypothetical protein
VVTGRDRNKAGWGMLKRVRSSLAILEWKRSCRVKLSPTSFGVSLTGGILRMCMNSDRVFVKCVVSFKFRTLSKRICKKLPISTMRN